MVRFAAKLTRYLSLALLPALASEARAASVTHRKLKEFSSQPAAARSSTGLAPFLAVVRPTGIRFAAPPPPRGSEPVFPPSAPAPAETGETPGHETPVASPALENPPEVLPAQPSETPPAPVRAPLPILPDDTRREIRPEDVLPFFHYPHSDGPPIQVILPATAPPSSATYQQRP